MIDNESMKLLLNILANPMMKVENFMHLHQLSSRQLQSKLDQLNDVLEGLGYQGVQIYASHFQIDPAIEDKIMSEEFLQCEKFVIDEKLRPALIYLYVFVRQMEVSSYHLQWLLQVSKNTATSDVKTLRNRCLKHHLQFIYTRKDGYHIQGTEMDKRRFAIICMDQLLEYPLGKRALEHMIEDWNEQANIKPLVQQFETTLQQHQLLVPLARLEVIVWYYRLLLMRKHDQIELTELQINCIEKSGIMPVAEELIHQMNSDWEETEAYYLAAILLGVVQGNYYDQNSDLIQNYADQMILFVEQKLAIIFDKRLDLQKGLRQHLLPAYYRIIFEIPIANPLREMIIERYRFLFDIVKQSLIPFEKELDVTISDNEITYLTMYFGGKIKSRKAKKEQLTALVICPNGISSSQMLKSQLKELFPDFKWIVDAFKTTDSYKDVDMIFSTIFMRAEVPVYVTKPLLSIYEKNYLLDVVNQDFNIKNQKLPTVNRIIEIVQKYAKITNIEALEQDLSLYINNYTSIERTDQPMLKELLTKDYIAFSDQDLTWEEAIALSAKPLADKEKINPSYVEAIINRVNEFGPYIHIGKNVAIPHARPEDGVNEIGMSFLKLDKPVLLQDKPEHEVDMFITLAAVDNTTHLRALSSLTRILSTKEKMEELENAKTVEDVLAVISSGEEA
ncbi:transcriptional antiterminator, BglG family [Granulicatella balaenopterae]|uniref:Ascorbate-specific PTS system EIIA component n=1 Tax=Granulicatella balaenopterae TaxID=137733 RepID=A0A1H9LH34_9LACT|nr:BglG family transcription antiterminator [Granulicatella balaenopterae]SER10527.1 transcriptional antiterminator, BglG family [Granulicatella balaenopterae]